MQSQRGDRRLSPVWALILAAAVVVSAALTGCGALGTQSAETTATSGGGPALDQRGSLTAPEASKDAAVAGEGYAVSAPDAATVPASQRLIVRTKTMRVEVKGVSAAVDAIRAMAKRDGADITSMQVATSSDEPIYRPLAESDPQAPSATLQAFVTVRVPVDKYAAFVDEAAKLGRVLWQGETTDDVTQQHVDLKARLDNLRAEEVRLRDFFNKAKNVSEMLAIEQELSRVRGEVESLAAQVAYLERQAAMATVTIELTEPKPLVRPTGTDWGVAKAFTDSIRAFVGTLNVLIVMLGPALAILVFVALPVFLVVRWLVRRSRKRAAVAASVDDASGERADG